MALQRAVNQSVQDGKGPIMHRLLFSVAIAAVSMAVAPSAGAAEFTSTGYVESVNPAAHTLRISGGDEYRFSPDADLSQYHPGYRVHIGWNTQNPRVVFEGSDNTHYLVHAISIRQAE